MTKYDRDIEYEAYLDEKRQINEKIHEHWNKELNQPVIRVYFIHIN